MLSYLLLKKLKNDKMALNIDGVCWYYLKDGPLSILENIKGSFYVSSWLLISLIIRLFYGGYLSKMKDKQKDFRTEKYIRYGIRKYSFGATSVAIAAGLMFLGNGAVSATEVQGAETAVAATSAKKDNQNTAEVKPEVKAEEAKKVNKAILEASIATLESKLATAKYADATVVNSAKEVLATAKAALAKAEASQADVDAQAATVSALSTVVTE